MVESHAARRVLGVVTIIVILSLVVAEAAVASVTIAPGRVVLLIALAGGLLGVDLVGTTWSDRLADVGSSVRVELSFGGETDDPETDETETEPNEETNRDDETDETGTMGDAN